MRDAGGLEGLVEGRDDPAQVGARGHLGHDPAGRRVQRDLAGDDVGVDPPPALDQRDAGLVAARLDREDQRAAHAGALARPAPGWARWSAPRVAGRARATGAARRRAPPAAADPVHHRRRRERLRRHDQGVFLVVAVVARPDPDRPEAVLLVQPARGEVRQADLERRLARVAVDGQVEHREQQPLPDPPAPVRRVDREGRDVRLVDHQPDPAVGDDLAAQLADEVVGEPVALELLPVRLRRPGRGERRVLDPLDGAQVGDGHRPDGQDDVGHDARPAADRDAAVVRRRGEDPARERHVLGDEAGEVVGTVARPGGPSPGPGADAARPSRATAPSATASSASRPSRSTATSRSPASSSGSAPPATMRDGPRPARQHAVRLDPPAAARAMRPSRRSPSRAARREQRLAGRARRRPAGRARRRAP